MDRLYWLDSKQIAIIFYHGGCCVLWAPGPPSYEVRAVTFDLSGQRKALRDWHVDESHKRRALQGPGGYVVVTSEDGLEFFNFELATVKTITIPNKSTLWVSKNGGDSFALRTPSELLFYPRGPLDPPSRLAIPVSDKATPEDILGTSAIFNGKCGADVWQLGRDGFWRAWTGGNQQSNCLRPLALLSQDSFLAGGQNGISIVHRNGEVETVSQLEGKVLETTPQSGRFLVQAFRPNAMAQALDMDFGGTKRFLVYDISSHRVIFEHEYAGDAGAALSPDGHHLAIVEHRKLLIYDLPD